jgi:excinuclease ABC subunit C
MLSDMVVLATTVEYTQTDTALEALLLESELIKKHKPKYNTKEKDNKSWNYVIITRDAIPQVQLIRGRNLKIEQELANLKPRYTFGPFSNGGAIKEGLRIIRRIFPFVDKRSVDKDKYEFYKQLGLTPDTSDKYALDQYKKNIAHIVLFFQGKKKDILKNLRTDMMRHAKLLEFEQANSIKKQVFALEHINDIAVIKADFLEGKIDAGSTRIESYDIAHLGGKEMVGVMTVVQNGEVDKTQYRKFIIRTQTDANDTGALYEVLMRRFRHSEWGLPDVVVVDGGVAQLRIAEQVLKFYQLDIPIVSVLKDERHKPKDILGDSTAATKYKREILLSNSEAHRFAITFHKEKRSKKFLSNSKQKGTKM